MELRGSIHVDVPVVRFAYALREDMSGPKGTKQPRHSPKMAVPANCSASASRTSQAAGRALTFMIAASVVVVWAVTGPIFNIQTRGSSSSIRYDNRHFPDGLPDPEFAESRQRGHQVKLDELIRVSTAQNSFVGIEHLTDDELEEIRSKCERRAEAEKIGGHPSSGPEKRPDKQPSVLPARRR